MYSYVDSGFTTVKAFFFYCFAATQLARQLHQERTQVVCSNREARKRPARRQSRNGLVTFELKAYAHTCRQKKENMDRSAMTNYFFKKKLKLGGGGSGFGLVPGYTILS